MNDWKTADAVVRRLEAAIPAAELRVRDDVGGRAR